jgi:hypothetical protein
MVPCHRARGAPAMSGVVAAVATEMGSHGGEPSPAAIG